jgi:hypothetical protein
VLGGKNVDDFEKMLCRDRKRGCGRLPEMKKSRRNPFGVAQSPKKLRAG